MGQIFLMDIAVDGKDMTSFAERAGPLTPDPDSMTGTRTWIGRRRRGSKRPIQPVLFLMPHQEVETGVFFFSLPPPGCVLIYVYQEVYRMRTNIVLNDELIKKAFRHLPADLP